MEFLKGHPDATVVSTRAMAGASFRTILRVDEASWDISFHPIHGEAGRSPFIELVGHDVTKSERQRLETASIARDLRERVKELTALTQVARLLQDHRELPVEDLMHAIVALIPPALKNPKTSAAEIRWNRSAFQAGPPTDHHQRLLSRSATRKGHLIEVSAFADSSAEVANDIAFLPEEQDLLDNIVEMLRLHLERRESEKEAIDRHRDLADTQKMAQVASWCIDLASDRIEVAEEMYRIYGLPVGPRTAPVEQFTQMIHPEDRAQVIAQHVRAVSEGHPITLDFRILREDGIQRWVHVMAEVVHASGKQYLRGFTQDITNQKEAEFLVGRLDRLEELNRFRAEFVSTAAHELNTPLTPIILQLELLKSGRSGDLTKVQYRTIQVIERNAIRLSLLVQDMLDSAQIQAQRLRLHRENTDLDTIAKDMIETFAPKAAEEGIKMRYDSPGPILLHADPRRLMQVVTNLLSNAIKFTEPSDAVTISLTRDGGHVHLSVQDSGRGMTREQMARIFQPFVQVHADPGITRGTGLGLYISYHIVGEHNGRMWVESEGPGEGTTFHVVLPRDTSDPPGDDESNDGDA